METINKTARSAAILYLLIVVLAPFSMLYLPSVIVVPGDAAATAHNVAASEGLFRLGLASDALIALIEVVLTALLYALLKPVSRTLALAAALARLAMTVIQGLNLLNHLFVLLLAGGAGALVAFTPDQLHALMLLFLNAHAQVVLIWGLFFGLHLALLGGLVYASGYLPRALGILLIVTALCYLVQSFGTILLPAYGALFTALASLSMLELAFPLWLLIKGVNGAQWQNRTPALA